LHVRAFRSVGLFVCVVPVGVYVSAFVCLHTYIYPYTLKQ